MDREPVYSVTSAKSGQHDDIGGRERRYVISMAIRTVCFVGAVIAWQTVGAWLGAILFVGALVLPYTSVILANAGTRSQASGSALLNHPPGTIDKRD
ncbi:MAG TPA: DUF3099 domain-containing protein [Aeromicrobium sp.]|nr:DUF3099 domain-containing protein [Aeromicrobium sp.]